MKILGIDQSFTKCAYVIIENDSMVEFGIIKSDSNADVYSRALDISLQLCNIYEKYHPDIVHIEGLAFGMRGDVTRDLAGLLFTIITTLKQKYPCVEYKLLPPTFVKKLATGSGKASKEEMIQALPPIIRETFLKNKFKKTTGLSDLADAFWIAHVNKS